MVQWANLASSAGLCKMIHGGQEFFLYGPYNMVLDKNFWYTRSKHHFRTFSDINLFVGQSAVEGCRMYRFHPSFRRFSIICSDRYSWRYRSELLSVELEKETSSSKITNGAFGQYAWNWCNDSGPFGHCCLKVGFIDVIWVRGSLSRVMIYEIFMTSPEWGLAHLLCAKRYTSFSSYKLNIKLINLLIYFF